MSVETSKKIEKPQTKENPKDVYSVFENSLAQYFNEVKKNAARYFKRFQIFKKK